MIVREITGVQPVDEYVRLSRWKWLGYVFRREGVIVRGTPGWQVQGRRGEELAQDRWWWRKFIEALCIPQGATGVD